MPVSPPSEGRFIPEQRTLVLPSNGTMCSQQIVSFGNQAKAVQQLLHTSTPSQL